MIHIPASRVEFTLGRLQITPTAKAAIEDSGDWIWSFVFRHMAGDWSALSDAERQQNEIALANGGQITSRFTMANGVKLVVRTEKEPRSSTTIMLAEQDTSNRSQ
jgi:hypothetical protein